MDEEEDDRPEEVEVKVVDSEESGAEPEDEHYRSAQKNNQVCVK